MYPDAHARLRAAIEQRNAERGRPLTAREKLANLRRWLASVDTHAKRGDSTQIEAPSPMGSAVPKADAHPQSGVPNAIK
jgi:hypothetical protein